MTMAALNPLSSSLWPYASLVLLLLLLSRMLLLAFSRINRLRRARQLGCQPPPAWPLPWWDYFGLVLLRQTLAAARHSRFPEWLEERHNTVRAALGRPASTYTIKNAGQTMIFTSDPRNVQAVLATQFRDFSISPIRQKSFGPLLLNGIFVANGPRWEHARNLLRPSFARDRVSDLDMERRHNASLLSVIPFGSRGWSEPVDLQPLFFRLTIDSSTDFLFGESVNSQTAALNTSHTATHVSAQAVDEIAFTRAFDLSQNLIADRARLGALYWLRQSSTLRDATKTCHDFIDQYVHRALERFESRKGKPLTKAGNRDGQTKYIFLDELVQQTQDVVEVRSQLINILLAGRDTTAGLLSFLFSLLARHPHVLQRLRQSILADFGAADDSEGSITFASLKGCKYLQHCLHETLRLYPVVPSNGRSAVRDTTLPVGGGLDGTNPVFVPKGTIVQYSVYVMHRDPSVWDAPTDFRPERWEGRRQSFEYVPFNAGPRICLGQQFALTSAAFTTVYMLQRFDAIECVDQHVSDHVGQAVSLTSRPSDGVKVRLHSAGVP